METMKRVKSGLFVAAAVAALALPSAALGGHGHGNGGGNGNMGVHGGMHDSFGGNSSAHISARGMANTNGPNATTRVFGRDRARLRHNRFNANFSTGESSERAMTARLNGRSHVSAQGLANGNGINATTKLHGRDRANARHALHLIRHPDNDGDDDSDE